MKILVLSGASGTGKGTVVNELLVRCPQLQLIRSYTTRLPRNEKESGYHFTTRETFDRMREEHSFLESNFYAGEWYGTPRDEVEQCIAQGRIALVEIDAKGRAAIVASGEYDSSDICSVFIAADAETVYKRLIGRGTESAEQLKQRLATAIEEAGRSTEYDALFINDDLNKTVAALQELIRTGILPPRPDFDVAAFQIRMAEILNGEI